MHLAIASDHAGFEYKTRLILYLIECGHFVEDFGTDSPKAVDYPLMIRPLAEAVAAGEFERGIVLGGSGNGEAIVANRIPGVRCTLCWNLQTARWARAHNDANVLALGQRTISFEEAREIVDCWLETPFDGGRHARRVRQIDQAAPQASHAGHRLPHRTDFVEEVVYICSHCRVEFTVPVDISGGSRQYLVEECPVCCHENTILVFVDAEGEVTIQQELPTTE